MFNQEFEAFCKDGLFTIDMSSLVPASSLDQFKELDITIDDSQMFFPSFDTASGTELEGSEMTISADMGGIGTMRMTFVSLNRKVEAKETITVPAGSFECIVITQDFQTTVMGMTIKSSSKDWYAEGIGMIRSENYNKKGKLEGYSELTKLAN